MLKRGDVVIINDVDAPEAKMLAVLTKYDADAGAWHARYLTTATRNWKCGTANWTPTKVEDFGMRLEWRGDEFRVVPNGAPCVATYDDGVPRRWQDYSGREWWTTRPEARKLVR